MSFILSKPIALRKVWFVLAGMLVILLAMAIVMFLGQKKEEDTATLSPNDVQEDSGGYPTEAEIRTIMAQAEAGSDGIKPDHEEMQKVFEVLIQEDEKKSGTKPTPEEIQAVFDSALQPTIDR